MQVYNAGIDQTTLRPAIDVEYVLQKDGKEVFKQAEDWRGNSDAGQRLTLARLLPTSNLAPGEYEIVVRVRDKEVVIRPIAGTRPRGETPEADRRLAAELLADPKERAEHLMLLDLGRNDVGRVAEIGTVKVTDQCFLED